MIDPDVVFYDLEPDGFARLNQLVLAYVYASKPEIHLLHDRGEVLEVVHTVDGFLDEWREGFEDPSARAQQILRASGVDRVLIVDRSQASSISTAVTSQASAPTQMQLLWETQRAFHGHPGVVSAPARPDRPWPWTQDRLREVGDDWWALGAVWEAGELLFSVLARVLDGRVVEVTSFDHLRERRPRREQALDVIALSERLGSVRFAVLCDVEVLDGITDLADLASRRDDLIASRGLELVFER